MGVSALESASHPFPLDNQPPSSGGDWCSVASTGGLRRACAVQKRPNGRNPVLQLRGMH